MYSLKSDIKYIWINTKNTQLTWYCYTILHILHCKTTSTTPISLNNHHNTKGTYNHAPFTFTLMYFRAQYHCIHLNMNSTDILLSKYLFQIPLLLYTNTPVWKYKRIQIYIYILLTSPCTPQHCNYFSLDTEYTSHYTTLLSTTTQHFTQICLYSMAATHLLNQHTHRCTPWAHTKNFSLQNSDQSWQFQTVINNPDTLGDWQWNLHDRNLHGSKFTWLPTPNTLYND